MEHSETVETMNKEINFILERYRSGGSNRYTCPQCGKRKCFTRYINVETGEYVGEECGICNHVSSCGYHYPPREYYRDHPQLENFGQGLLSRTPLKKIHYHSQEFVQTEFSHWNGQRERLCERALSAVGS